MDMFVATGMNLGSILWYSADVFIRWIPATVVVVSGLGGAEVNDIATVGALEAPVPVQFVPGTLDIISPIAHYTQLTQAWGQFVALSIAFSLIMASVIIYSLVRTRQIRILERQQRLASVHPVAAKDVSRTQLRWERILQEVGGEDEHKWRVALLEADILLNELLDVLGYKGETMADKMRHVVKADFNSIDLAWEAHKIRNRVAHDGAEFPLSAREARRVIGLYDQVFREFKFIV